MPDAEGNFKGMAVPAEAWERIFGQGELFERKPPTFDEMIPLLEERLRERHGRERELYERLGDVDEAR